MRTIPRGSDVSAAGNVWLVAPAIADVMPPDRSLATDSIVVGVAVLVIDVVDVVGDELPLRIAVVPV